MCSCRILVLFSTVLYFQYCQFSWFHMHVVNIFSLFRHNLLLKNRHDPSFEKTWNQKTWNLFILRCFLVVIASIVLYIFAFSLLSRLEKRHGPVIKQTRIPFTQEHGHIWVYEVFRNKICIWLPVSQLSWFRKKIPILQSNI